MNLEAKQAELISDLLILPDAHERLSVLLSRSTRMCLADDAKVAANRVAGCVSEVWLTASESEGIFVFKCDAESPMVKALITLLCELYSGSAADDIRRVEPEIWEKCGLLKVLSPTRINGLRAVRQRMVSLVSVSR